MSTSVDCTCGGKPPSRKVGSIRRTPSFVRRVAQGSTFIALATLALATLALGPALAQGAPPAAPPSSPSTPPSPSPPQPPQTSQTSPSDPNIDEADAEVIDVEDAAPKPVPKDKGVIAGTVVESQNGESIIDAQVQVIGAPYKTLTDLDGNYRLELPPGTYELRIFYEGHKSKRIQKATVGKAQTLRLDVSLESSAVSEDVVEIQVTPDRSSAATQILIRKNAVNVGDAVSAQEIAKTPDRNAAEAAKRVVGATILDGRFVLVRGLSERYTNALLNGSPLPSPEPDRQSVPLDLFPSLVLSDISILKTFSPDMPGDFAGGSVSIHTRKPTEIFQIAATASIGANTLSTFQNSLSYKGGSTDFLGIDSGKRGLPKGFPTYRVVSGVAKPDGSIVTDEEVWAAGKRINSSMATEQSFTPPNYGLNVVASGTVSAGALGELGATAALTYGRRYTAVRNAVIRRFNFYIDPAKPNDPFPYKASVDATGESGNDKVSWGGLAVVSLRPSSDHRITLTGITSRSSDNETRVISGYNEGADATLEDTRLRFVSRGLFFGELLGEHRFTKLRNFELDYRLSGSLATLDEPDTRQVSYQLFDDAEGKVQKYWNASPTLSGQHFYGSQSEKSIGGAVDLTQPILEGITPLKLKGGVFFQMRDRELSTRRFHFRPQNGVVFTEYVKPPDQIFADKNIGPVVDFDEWTRDTDNYAATQSLYAGYLMADFAPMPWVRFIAGARVEAWSQNLESFDPFAPDVRTQYPSKDSFDVLPALNVVFKTTKNSNLRASLARTVARPQLREVAPFLFSDFVGSLDQQGNPELNPSSIVNADVRFEVFPGAADVIALSAFYKQFFDPIEAIILGGNGTLTYANAAEARILGLEFEVKKGLGFISPVLADISPLANITVSTSRVELGDTGGTQTSNVRPLVGQSPLVLNLGIDYTNETTGTRGRIVYNFAAARIRAAGANGLLDWYEQPRHLMDISVAQKVGKYLDLKVTAENVLQAPFRVTFGSENADEHVVEEQQAGTTFSLSATVNY